MSRTDHGHNVTTVGPAGATAGLGGTSHIDVNAAVVNTPVDRIRWGAVFGGIFAALSLLIILFVLGSAVGLSAYDRGDNARNFAIGAGWWAAISALLSFMFGGWLAAKTAAVRGRNWGLLNGAMVWAVAIPLSLLLFTGGMNSLMHTASNAAEGRDLKLSNLPVDPSAPQQVPPERIDEAKRAAAKGAWGTLVSLLLGLGAAALGGYMGARTLDRHVGDDRHHGAATTT